MSLAVRQSMLFAFIHVASLGADQFSFGMTLPPKVSIVFCTAVWMFLQPAATSTCSSSSEFCPLSSEAEKMPLSSDHSGSALGSSSSGRMMPSARR